MIHRVCLEKGSELGALKKLFRKKLMTGGAVFELAEGLGEEGQLELIERFSGEAREYNLAGLALETIAKQGEDSELVVERLRGLGLRRVERAIIKRAHGG